MEIQDDKLSVEKCDVFNEEEVRPHVQNTDVVVSCLGFNGVQKQDPVP